MHVWGVNIISMSFGYESEVEVIETALRQADQKGVLLIAAASNVGGNTSRAKRWPSTRDNVLAIYAAGGKGEDYTDNPPPMENRYNFTTLGVMIPVWTIPNETGFSTEICCTGTSYATPVAAAIAATVLDFIWHTEKSYLCQYDSYPKHLKAALQARVSQAKETVSRASGMSKVFKMMAETKGCYDYVQPTNLLTSEFVRPESIFGNIMEKLLR